MNRNRFSPAVTPCEPRLAPVGVGPTPWPPQPPADPLPVPPPVAAPAGQAVTNGE